MQRHLYTVLSDIGHVDADYLPTVQEELPQPLKLPYVCHFIYVDIRGTNYKKELNRTNLHGTAMFKEWQKEDYPK